MTETKTKANIPAGGGLTAQKDKSKNPINVLKDNEFKRTRKPKVKKTIVKQDEVLEQGGIQTIKQDVITKTDCEQWQQKALEGLQQANDANKQADEANKLSNAGSKQARIACYWMQVNRGWEQLGHTNIIEWGEKGLNVKKTQLYDLINNGKVQEQLIEENDSIPPAEKTIDNDEITNLTETQLKAVRKAPVKRRLETLGTVTEATKEGDTVSTTAIEKAAKKATEAEAIANSSDHEKDVAKVNASAGTMKSIRGIAKSLNKQLDTLPDEAKRREALLGHINAIAIMGEKAGILSEELRDVLKAL